MAMFFFLAQVVFFLSLLLLPSSSQEYIVTVTAYPLNGPYRSGQDLEIPLQCNITPTPPEPVEYLWRSSVGERISDEDIPSTSPITTVFIREDSPIFGYYFCHVLSLANQTTLAVGNVRLHITGILEPVGTTNKVFTPPSPLKFGVKSTQSASDKRLLRSINSLTYEWKHNGSKNIRDIQIRGNTWTISQTRPNNAGNYSVQITSFGVSNNVNKTCSTILLQALKHYAVFQDVSFQAMNGPVNRPITLSRGDEEMQNVTFISGEAFKIEVNIPLDEIVFLHDMDLKRGFLDRFIDIAIFYNGEYVEARQRRTASKQVRQPSLLRYHYVPLKRERAVSVTIEMPMPVPQDEGVYEVKVTYDVYEVSRALPPGCYDYNRLLESSDGLNIYDILVGSAILNLQQYVPKIAVMATQVILSADGTDPPPTLSCLVEEGTVLVEELKWSKGNTELARVQLNQELDFNTASIEGGSVFGTYTCEAGRGQNKAMKSIHIAERAQLNMQLLPVNDIRCSDIDQVSGALMETLLRELEFSFSVNGFANVTRDNFANPSLSCTSNSVMMSSDIVFANSDGSLTASALVDSGQNWINGVRTVNGLSFQLTRPTNVPNLSSSAAVDGGQLAAIILTLLLVGTFAVGAAILATCIIMKYRKRSEHKVLDQESHETEQQPSSTGPVVNNTTGIKNSFSLHKIEDPQVMILPRDMPLKKQSSTLPTVFNREGGQLRNGGQPESRPSGIKFGSHRFNIEAIRQQNNCEREDGEMTHKNSVVVSPNLAYNRVTSLKENSRQLRDSECQQNRQNGPRSNVRQMSGDHSYDYPQMGLGAGYWRAGKRRSNGPLSTYDSIATVTNTSYSVGNK